jgi:hypothetical protein
MLRLVPPLALAAAPDDRRRRPASPSAARVGDRLRFRGDEFESDGFGGGEEVRGEVAVLCAADPAGVVVVVVVAASSLPLLAIDTGLRSWQAPHRRDRTGLAKVQRGHGHDDDAAAADEYSGVEVGCAAPGLLECARWLCL